jgi:nucleoside-diphosphate-sugar epimerase
MSLNKKKILITGGCGYVGSLLTDQLSKKGYKITIIDTLWFGKNYKNKKNIELINEDIRNIHKFNFKNYYAIIHLANISNDPSAIIDAKISWEINVLASYQLAEKAKLNGVKKFIYASSGSVYGVKRERQVTEKLSLVPVSTYNKTKMIYEKILLPLNDKNFKVYCVRPGTICGLSPRMRWDLSVNALTLDALKYKEIKVFGGKQFRPHIHINDMIRVYEHFLKKNICPGIYNASTECFTINKLAKFIKKKINSRIQFYKSNDIRSYRLNSSKLFSTGFVSKYSVEDAINDIINIEKFKKINVGENNFNLKKMQKLIDMGKIK